MEFLDNYDEEIENIDVQDIASKSDDNKNLNVKNLPKTEIQNSLDSKQIEDDDNEEDYEQYDNDEVLTEYGDESDDDGISDDDKRSHKIDNVNSLPKQTEIEILESEKIETEQDMDSYCLQNKIPISHQIDLKGHSKAVTCFSIEPTGNRVITGSLDYSIRAYDFGGMDSRHTSFRSLEPENGYPVTSISHSPNGDRFIISTGSAQCIVYDRECALIIKFAKGDMYLRDLVHTKGHTMEVTCVNWHPSEKNLILSSSLDGSLRIWDLLGEAHFGNIISKHVLKLKSTQGQSRLAALCCCYSPDGSKILGGAADGSIHIWTDCNNKKTFSRCDCILRSGLKIDNPINWVTVSSDGNLLAARSTTGKDQKILVWDIKKLSSASMGFIAPKPIFECSNLVSEYTTANVDFSPDNQFICCAANQNIMQSQSIETLENTNNNNLISSHSDSLSNDKGSFLLFFNIQQGLKEYKQKQKYMNSKEIQSKSNATNSFTLNLKPCLKISTGKNTNAIMVKWQTKTNQIFCSSSEGQLKVFFDPRVSVKGALLSSSRPSKRQIDAFDVLSTDPTRVIGEIINPHALPMYRNDPRTANQKPGKRGGAVVVKTPGPSKPDKTSTELGGSNRSNTSFFFTQYVMKNRAKDNTRSEDPREALLALDSVARSDPMFLGNAYSLTQPTTVLTELTVEAEQEEFKKKQKRVI